MDQIFVQDINVSKKTITIKFAVDGEIGRFFTTDRISIEYDIDLDGLPKGIAVLPFICNVLPIVWLTDSQLHVPVLDKVFYNSIEKFKKGYIDMYPMLEFKGSVIADCIEENNGEGRKSACFFSGGLDAYATLIAHIDEKPTLLTLRGADVKLDDIKGWENVSKPIVEAAKEYNLEYRFITTTFRTFINEGKLHTWVLDSGSPDGWWHGFQHGLGIISHAAPICYLEGISKLYIASSFTPADKGRYTCASDPTIDNHVRFASTQVIHDQYEYNAQEKTQHVCEYVRRTGKHVNMHVCWQSQGGKNCCRCEKCYRRLMEIIAEGCNPNDFGFPMDKAAYRHMKDDMLGHILLKHTSHWKSIKKRFIENKNNIIIRDVDWIYTIPVEVDKFNNMPLKRWNRFKKEICSLQFWKSKIRRVLYHG